MQTRNGWLPKSGAIGVSMLMLTLSIAVPVLERADLADEPVVESEHNPAECPPGHDHTICTLVGANLSAASTVDDHPGAGGVVHLALLGDRPAVVLAAFDEAHPSRAPPLA